MVVKSLGIVRALNMANVNRNKGYFLLDSGIDKK